MQDQNDNGVEKQLSVKKQLDKILQLREEMKSNKLNQENKFQSEIERFIK